MVMLVFCLPASPALLGRSADERQVDGEDIALARMRRSARCRPSPRPQKSLRRHRRRRRRVVRRARRARSSASSGPNGSGKSTLFNCILGQLRPSAGDVRLDGRAVTGMRPCDLNRLGVSRTFQLLQVFPQLTVRENLILAGQEHQGTMLSRLFGPRDAGLSGRRGPDARVLPPRPSRRRAGRRLELRPAEAARRRDGVHGRARASCCSTSRPAAST